MGSGLSRVERWNISDSGTPSVKRPRMMRNVSANPLVVIRPVTAPEPVISALSPMVQAWKNSRVEARSSASSASPILSAASRTAFSAPME